MCRVQSVMVIGLFVGLAAYAYSWDIAVTAGDRLEFYTSDGNKLDTVHFNSQNLTALAYDEVHNMLLYVDKQSDNDAICGYNITSVEYKCYLERNGRNIQGLAFDPVTELLFFTDTKERSINWFSFKQEYKNNIYGKLLIKLDDGIPTDIAVDSCRGFVYWVNRNLTTSTIERARFDGSEREVVINATYKLDLHSLAIDQQTKKIYWFMPKRNSRVRMYSADLNGKNKGLLNPFYSAPGDILLYTNPNTLTVTKGYLVAMLGWCSPCRRFVWSKGISRTTADLNIIGKTLMEVHTKTVVGIAANYKMKDQFQGISDCKHLVSNYKTDDSFKIAREYEGTDEGPSCAHGIIVSGQFHCKCTPGYTGERCYVSVCENSYCFQGNYSITDEGLPKCSCNAGFSGERCEVNLCHGYCFQGNCSFNEEGLPKCRCVAGYSGERCEVNLCLGYCLNNGTCFLTEEDEPGCECVGEYEGERCDVPVGLNNGDGSLNEGGQPASQCVGSREGSKSVTVENKTSSTTSSCFLVDKNITLVDLLENWSKRAQHLP